MNTRGQGRVRAERQFVSSEKGRHEAERFLNRRLGEIAAEQHGGRSFVGPQQERVTVNDLLASTFVAAASL
jgi:hypothetical protein